ncbi:hypothetical protein GH714_035812 [Hevea brasiliensis]|uniref:TF-B3 domain-containing protein n=1 Tax=Hevea brasiliensis TaxID=3981 RepID=A0A6A6L3R0_HEVBR|nr:hypothetical protein GH714_035812 [Hevea brasiliensis]
MDSCPKKGDGRLMFKATKPHFFKIILDDTIRSRKLGIPRRFVRRYGSELSSPVFLKVPSGAKWQVQLVKCNGEIWLENGWQEFVEYYSLVFGYFLIFEFEQNCHFNVFVFDKSASEIDYPFNITNAYDEEPNLEEECPDPEIEETENDPTGGLDFAAKRSKEGMSNEKKSLDGVAGRKQPLTAEEKANALHNAGTKFKSGNPYFMIAMQPSYLHRLCIPASFMKDYFNKNSGSVALITEDRETWSVDFSYTLCNGRASATLRHGWKKFVQENHLEVGDVCVFELINRIAIRFKVGIFRHIKDANSSLSLDAGTSKQLKDEESSCCRQFNPGNSCSKAFGAIEAAKKFTSVNPFFKVIINSCHLENSLVCIPRKFVRKYGKDLSSPVLLEVPCGRIWQVELTKCDGRNPGAKIIKETENDASADFVLCRKTKEKSPLSSPRPEKMTKVENPTENTSLHCPGKQVEEVDFAGESGYGGISGQKQTSYKIVARLNVKEKSKALNRARTNFKSKNPFFLVAMQPSYVRPGEKLTIPRSFAMKYFPKKHDGDATLNGLNGRAWSVKYYVHTAARNGETTAKITKVNSKSRIDEESNPPGAIEAAKSFTSVHPFFKLVISSGHLRLSIVHVPHNFISNIKQNTKKAKLQVENRWWPVKLTLYPHYAKGLFLSGWSVFARENSLQMGDVCIFELIDCETVLVKVTIFRNVK